MFSSLFLQNSAVGCPLVFRRVRDIKLRLSSCRGGGIGIRVRFRSVWEKSREGSNPFLGTRDPHDHFRWIAHEVFSTVYVMQSLWYARHI